MCFSIGRLLDITGITARRRDELDALFWVRPSARITPFNFSFRFTILHPSAEYNNILNLLCSELISIAIQVTIGAVT